MSSPTLKSVGSKSFLWTFPECPVRIRVDFQFIDRLQKEILENAPADREVGGLLVANELSPNGDIEVSDYLCLPPASETTKNFIVCSGSLTKAIQGWSTPQRRVIGFYRTHLEPRIDLRAEDVECIRSKFNDPKNVFLVIRPHDGRHSAGFYFWSDGAVVGGLTFPFSSTELRSPYWSTLMGGAPKESLPHSLLAGAKDRALRVSTALKVGFLALIAILIALAGAIRLYRETSNPPHTLGLRVERALLGIVVAWDPAAPEIATAQDGDLLIWDGSSPPAFVRLSSAQLRTGRAFFTSISDRVEVRLDVIGTSGVARTESIVSTSHATDASAPANSSPPPVQPPPVITENSSTRPVEEVKGTKAPATPPRQPAVDASSTFTQLSRPPGTRAEVPVIPPVLHTLDNREAASPPEVSDRPEPPPIAAETQQQQTAPLIGEQPQGSSFQAAVPIREMKPAIPVQVGPLIHSDNVVEVQVHINASGNVTEAKVGAVKGPVAGLLSRSAVNAALAWRFRPATQNGAPVASEKILEFLFRPPGH